MNMFGLLLIVFLSLFVVLLFLNLYFRIKLLKIYRQLVEKEVEFPASYILNRSKLVDEVIPKYPHAEKLILTFHRQLMRSLGIAFLVFILSLLIGYQYILNR